MKCENCNKEHDGSYGSGRFCCDKCARTYSSSKVDKNRTKIVQCIDCGVDLEVSIYASPKQCKCDNCRGGRKYKNLKLTNCINCGNKLVNKGKYCCKKCQNDYQYKQYIEKWKNNEVSGTQNGTHMKHSKHIRRYLWEKYNGQCSRCGWNTPNPVTGKPMLEVEHIDGNNTNNRPENLDLICPNCHSLTETYNGLNIGKGSKRWESTKNAIINGYIESLKGE